MTEFVVGARFEIQTNELVAAAKANAEQLEKLKQVAAEAAREVDGLVDKQGKLTSEGKAAVKTVADQVKEYERVEKQLTQYLTRVSDEGKAVKVQAEGLGLLNRARELGIISQAQYTKGLAEVEKAAEKHRLTVDNLTKGKLSFSEGLKVGTSALAGLVGGLAGSLATMVASEVATLALAAATKLFSEEGDTNAKVLGRIADAMAKAKGEKEKYKASAEELAGVYRANTKGALMMAEADLKAAQAKLALLEATLAMKSVNPEMPDISGDDVIAVRLRERIRKIQDMMMMFRIERGEFDGQVGEYPTGGEQRAPVKPTKDDRTRTGARGTRVSDVEKDMLRQADAAIKARRALDEYGEATQDIVEKARAEFDGRREIIAQIELEAQLRKKHGVAYVEQNRERIVAMAQERAAAQRVADQYSATAGFIESSFDRVGDAINAGLALPLDHSADAMKNFENQVYSSVRAIVAELNRLAVVNPILNAITGGSRPTAYGEGGLLQSIGGAIGGLFGGSYQSRYASSYADPAVAPPYHDGGFVGDGRPGRYVPQQLFYSARKAHAGLYLGPGEVPIVAKKGEAVFTPRQMDNAGSLLSAALSRRGGEAPIINIIDQRGAGAPPVETRSRRGAGGRIETDVIVKEGGKKAIARGEWDSAMESRYGVKVRTAR